MLVGIFVGIFVGVFVGVFVGILNEFHYLRDSARHVNYNYTVTLTVTIPWIHDAALHGTITVIVTILDTWLGPSPLNVNPVTITVTVAVTVTVFQFCNLQRQC